jgi:hypothetical protein
VPLVFGCRAVIDRVSDKLREHLRQGSGRGLGEPTAEAEHPPTVPSMPRTEAPEATQSGIQVRIDTVSSVASSSQEGTAPRRETSSRSGTLAGAPNSAGRGVPRASEPSEPLVSTTDDFDDCEGDKPQVFLGQDAIIIHTTLRIPRLIAGEARLYLSCLHPVSSGTDRLNHGDQATLTPFESAQH